MRTSPQISTWEQHLLTGQYEPNNRVRLGFLQDITIFITLISGQARPGHSLVVRAYAGRGTVLLLGFCKCRVSSLHLLRCTVMIPHCLYSGLYSFPTIFSSATTTTTTTTTTTDLSSVQWWWCYASIVRFSCIIYQKSLSGSFIGFDPQVTP